MFGFINPKIVIQPNVWLIVGGIVTGTGVVLGVVVNIVTRNFITWKEGKKEFASKEISEKENKNLSGKVDLLDTNINRRLDDIIRLMEKNSK